MKDARQAGYSLIELLVVIIIAGVLTTVVLLRFTGDSEQEQAANSLNQLSASIDLLCDQALLTGQLRGVRLSRDGYDFWALMDGQWQPLPNAQPPRARQWPEALLVEIQIEQRQLGQTNPELPQIWCSPLEPISSFEVELGSGQARQTRQWPNHVL